VLEFENLNDGRQKKSWIKATNGGGLPINMSNLREIKVLGCGMFGVVKLMEDEDGERYAVKYFKRTWDWTEGKAAAAFSLEFTVRCKLNHPFVIPFYGFSAATPKSETALIMKYMENVK
jgi:serine/threonine protein kinase